jgi:hypothetical protein
MSAAPATLRGRLLQSTMAAKQSEARVRLHFWCLLGLPGTLNWRPMSARCWRSEDEACHNRVHGNEAHLPRWRAAWRQAADLIALVCYGCMAMAGKSLCVCRGQIVTSGDSSKITGATRVGLLARPARRAAAAPGIHPAPSCGRACRRAALIAEPVVCTAA